MSPCPSHRGRVGCNRVLRRYPARGRVMSRHGAAAFVAGRSSASEYRGRPRILCSRAASPRRWLAEGHAGTEGRRLVRTALLLRGERRGRRRGRAEPAHHERPAPLQPDRQGCPTAPAAPISSSSTGLGSKATSPRHMKKGSGNKNLKIVDLGARIPQDKLFEGSCHHDHGDGARPRPRQGPARLAQSGLRDHSGRGHPRRAEGSRPGATPRATTAARPSTSRSCRS